MFASETTSISH